MEAKDTVMNDKEIALVKYPHLASASITDYSSWVSEEDRRVAEISFKAGEKEMFRKLRQALRGEPTVFDYALSGIEIQWLYEHGDPTKRR